MCSFPDTGETHDDAAEDGNMVAADAGCRRTLRPSADRGLISHGVQVAARDQPFIGDPPGTRPHSRRRDEIIATGGSHMQRRRGHATILPDDPTSASWTWSTAIASVHDMIRIVTMKPT
jgi:hypothetical protein